MIKNVFLKLTFAVLAVLGVSVQASDQQRRTDPLDVVFDVGDTIVTSNYLASVKETGLKFFAAYAARHPLKILRLKKQLKKVMGAIEPEPVIPFGPESPIATKIDNPPLMRRWFCGASDEATKAKILTYIRNNQDQFDSNIERELLKNIFEMMFTPERLIKTFRPIPEMIQFMKECKKLHPGVRIFLLTNWGRSIDLLLKQYPELKELVNGYVSSAECGGYKPDKTPYITLFAKYDVNPDKAIFLDDVLENCQTAERLKMGAINWETDLPNMPEIHQKFRKLLIERAPQLLEQYDEIQNQKRKQEQDVQSKVAIIRGLSLGAGIIGNIPVLRRGNPGLAALTTVAGIAVAAWARPLARWWTGFTNN